MVRRKDLGELERLDLHDNRAADREPATACAKDATNDLTVEGPIHRQSW